MRRNAEKARAAMRRWRERHPQEHLAESHAYYQRNRARVDERNMRYTREHPDVRRAIRSRRRALAAGAAGSFTAAEWRALVERHGARCAYCGGEGPLEIEHRVPLSRGGTNDISNIVPACRGCNARKHDKTDEEFRAATGRLRVSSRLGSSVGRARDS